METTINNNKKELNLIFYTFLIFCGYFIGLLVARFFIYGY